jgi:hypothetical protein
MNAKGLIGGILFLFTELGIYCAAASAGYVSPDEGIAEIIYRVCQPKGAVPGHRALQDVTG